MFVFSLHFGFFEFVSRLRVKIFYGVSFIIQFRVKFCIQALYIASCMALLSRSFTHQSSVIPKWGQLVMGFFQKPRWPGHTWDLDGFSFGAGDGTLNSIFGLSLIFISQETTIIMSNQEGSFKRNLLLNEQHCGYSWIKSYTSSWILGLNKCPVS